MIGDRRPRSDLRPMKAFSSLHTPKVQNRLLWHDKDQMLPVSSYPLTRHSRLLTHFRKIPAFFTFPQCFPPCERQI